MNKTRVSLGVILSLAMIGAGACSTIKGGTKGEELSESGPTVLNVRSEPSTIELNRSMEPTEQAQVLAEVKDFTSKIASVKLRFLHAPLEIPMENIGGTTWRAVLTSQQLKTLAVAGETMRYDATVIATNAEGETVTSQQPVQVAVKAPELTQKVG